MKSLMLLWQRLAEESASRCDTCTTFDLKTVRGRVEHEGMSFLTISLPSFGKDFQKGLDQGYVDRKLFQGFAWRAGLPRFLGGFLDLVFDRTTGVLLDAPDIDAILAIRQLTLMFGKILLPCSNARRKDAMREYIKCEEDVREADRLRSESDISDFRRVSALLFSSVFQTVDRQVYEMDITPKHGPGATADRLRGNSKYRQSTWPARLDKVFPAGEYLLPNWRYFDQLDEVDILEPETETPVRVVSVPKTLKTPRIIGIEPTAMQYAQQGLNRAILDSLGRHDCLSRMIGFTDQSRNQEMARAGSLTGSLATLDLSEASDRVSNQLVREMMRNFPNLHGAVDATRSRKADVPGHGVVRLAKFASMGSALCFPMEAMVFTTLIFIGIERALSTPVDQKTVKLYSDQVRVYGDDIIVPVDFVSSVVDVLHSFGSVVNVGKSYWNGKFRESCGKEYYDGHDVSIVKVRREFPTQRKHVAEVVSLVSLRNQLYFAGYWQTVAWLDGCIRDILRYFPIVLPTSPVLGRHSFLNYKAEKIGEDLQNPLVKGYVVTSVIPQDNLDGSGALLKCLHRLNAREDSETDIQREASNGDFWYEPSVDDRHLERAGRPYAVYTKLRWSSPF